MLILAFTLMLSSICQPSLAQSAATPGDHASITTPSDQVGDAEPEHAFDGIYDPRQENLLLVRDCDGHISTTLIGNARETAIAKCVQNFREAINAGMWPQ
jgi:hypothetical protein